MRSPIHYATAETKGPGLGVHDTIALCGKHISGYDLETGRVKISHDTQHQAWITCAKCLKKLGR